MIFNIQKCSIHDGDGLRTTVFFKGCPLHCPWCANPESQSFNKEIMEFPKKCIGCGECVAACSNNLIFSVDGELLIDRSRCTKCFKCTNVCYAEAKKSVGEHMTADEIFYDVNKDRFFYQIKGGGVTFSGGEPLAQPDLLYETAKRCKENRINTAIETCGYGRYEDFKKVLDYVDAVFIDIKHMDSKIHEYLTGIGNETILNNIEKIALHGIPITIRTPIVPGYTDSLENIQAVANFIKNIPNIFEYELLPYHNLGESKYSSLGIFYQLKNVIPPTDEEMVRLVRAANQVLQTVGKQCFYTKKNKKEIIL